MKTCLKSLKHTTLEEEWTGNIESPLDIESPLGTDYQYFPGPK